MANASKTLFALFTEVRSIHRGFYTWKAMDDDKKKFIAQFASIIKYIQRAFANPCTM